MNIRSLIAQKELRFHPACIAVVTCLVVAALYLPTFIKLWQFWHTDPNFGHGFLVPVASLFLVWRARRRVREIPIEIGSPPNWMLVAGLLLHFVGFRGAVLSASALSFVVVLTWLLWFFFGKRFVQEISFPLFFLVFMIPIPFLDQLTFPLKALASRVSAAVIPSFGIPIYREGTVLFLPGFTLEVATACSGLKSLVVVTALGTFYSYMTQDAPWKRAVMVVCCVPIALLANIGRIAIVALLSRAVSTESLFHIVHDYSGLPVYMIAGVLLVATGEIVQWVFRRRSTSRLP